jgi:hypothetical protein
MPFPLLDQNKPRTIPTERLAALCEDFRKSANRTFTGIALIGSRVSHSSLPEEEKLEILAILDTMRPFTDLLAQTEAYLKYNKAKILKNRQAARKASPTYVPPHIYDQLPPEAKLSPKALTELEESRNFSNPATPANLSLSIAQQEKLTKQAEDSLELDFINKHGIRLYNLLLKHKAELGNMSNEEIVSYLKAKQTKPDPTNPQPSELPSPGMKWGYSKHMGWIEIPLDDTAPDLTKGIF